MASSHDPYDFMRPDGTTYRHARHDLVPFANIIIGCADDLVVGDLPAAELLLQQGIALLSLFPGEPREFTLH